MLAYIANFRLLAELSSPFVNQRYVTNVITLKLRGFILICGNLFSKIQNSSPHDCTENALSTEPSPQPLSATVRCSLNSFIA